MTAKIIDGKAIAAACRQNLKQRIQQQTASGQRAPGLTVILVGEDPASQVYVRNKQKACEEVGIHSQLLRVSAEISEDELLKMVQSLNNDNSVDGILVQLPLPDHINEPRVTESILPHKDVDGFHPQNIGRLLQKQPELRPCTPYGCIKLIESTGEPIQGKRAVVVGASNIVGRPMAMELLLANATVTICNSKTRDLRAEVARAEILVVGVGHADFIPGDWIPDGCIVIDVGINRLDDGSLAGDIAYATASERAGWITPVPGGVGPMTVAMLMENCMTAYLAHTAD